MQSLKTRLLFGLSFILLLFSAVFAWLILCSSQNYERELSQRMHRELAAHVVDNYLLYRDGKPDYDAAKKLFHDLMVLGPNFEFYLLNKDGVIVSADAKPEQLQLKEIDLQPLKAYWQEPDAQNFVLGEDPKVPGERKIFSVAPIYQMGEVYGYLYIVIGSQIRHELQAQSLSAKLMSSGLGVLTIVVVLLLLVAVFTLSLITRPLQRLTAQVQRLRAEGFQKKREPVQGLADELSEWSAFSENEIDVLGSAFREVLERLEQQYDKVVSVDELRKEMLSHLSHDLRTPLASMLGYLETWELQREELSEEQSRSYIKIARTNAQLISQLIEQLFELAQLDAANVKVRKETVAIADLVADVLLKFKVLAQEKGIELSLLPQDSSILVHADIEKLERVFSNLIENALRHTPNGGRVQIVLQPQGSKVSVDVADSGIGIPEQDLPYVFDAHFKAGNSVREDVAHGGLGLAITKKLLALHQSVISVQSQLNSGTVFSFSLEASAA
ncbi:sensor histidine kinase [Agaribacterium haliotis]|uniref:sensor histidine kinase n=1 Tax=Agaribacterium haliotis TaxID=2013869 RepID=UPI000BB576FC|nr:HAMP domain-containing sensor histidine kinase [Agaribacterium haliotis]